MPNYISGHTGGQIDDAVTKANCLVYAVCSTAAATVAKTVTINGFNSDLSKCVGVPIAIKFQYDVPAGATLAIGNTGAKAIYHNNAAIKAGVIKANNVVMLVYDGTHYVLSANSGNATVSGTVLYL